MSKYTTELRFVCESYAGLNASRDRSGVENVINTALPKIFDFDFPIFDENYRKILEKKIVYHYYTRELGYETVGLWKLKLQTKLQEIMPYYNKLYESELIEFNPLYSHDLYTKRDNTKTEDRDKTDGNTRTLNTLNTSTLNTTKTVNEGHDITIDDTKHDRPNETTYNLHSDTPQGGLTGVDSEAYLSDADKTIRSGDNTISNHHTDLGSKDTTTQDTGTIQKADTGTISDNRTIGEVAETVDDYLEHVYGYSGYNPNKMLKEYRENFLNIDMMIIKDLNKLFMGLW